jgi:hypothetical protein
MKQTTPTAVPGKLRSKRATCSPATRSDFPAVYTRALEARLLDLIASGNCDPNEWRKVGSAVFMAGLAMLCASGDELDRPAYLALAEKLQPGASRIEAFAEWISLTPVRAARFIPMLLQRL